MVHLDHFPAPFTPLARRRLDPILAERRVRRRPRRRWRRRRAPSSPRVVGPPWRPPPALRLHLPGRPRAPRRPPRSFIRVCHSAPSFPSQLRARARRPSRPRIPPPLRSGSPARPAPHPRPLRLRPQPPPPLPPRAARPRALPLRARPRVHTPFLRLRAAPGTRPPVPAWKLASLWATPSSHLCGETSPLTCSVHLGVPSVESPDPQSQGVVLVCFQSTQFLL